jgi:hypothetical protein
LRFQCDNCGTDDLSEDDIEIGENGEELCEDCYMELYPDQFEDEE